MDRIRFRRFLIIFNQYMSEKKPRKSASFIYETLPISLDKLFEKALPFMNKFREKIIWEPCAGRNAIVNYLSEKGFNSIKYSDKFHGENRRDFLKETIPDNFELIITNPPYTRISDFVSRCLELKKSFCILIPLYYLGYNPFVRSQVHSNVFKFVMCGHHPFKDQDGVIKNVVSYGIGWLIYDIDEQNPSRFGHLEILY